MNRTFLLLISATIYLMTVKQLSTDKVIPLTGILKTALFPNSFTVKILISIMIIDSGNMIQVTIIRLIIIFVSAIVTVHQIVFMVH